MRGNYKEDLHKVSIEIKGHFGFGKSTIAAFITNKLRELDINAIFIDDGYLPIDGDNLKDIDRLKDEIYVEVLSEDT